MCGISGFALNPAAERLDEAAQRARLERMTDSQVHRGPDDEGHLVRDGVALGFRRLSIIDLSPAGAQPILNETADVALTCNGEIYNFLELRPRLEASGHTFRGGSDMETVLHLYEERGAAVVDELVGMFALAIADFREAARPKLLLARDRVGIKPLYWAHTAEGLFYASEPKALLAAGLGRSMRPESLLHYLVQGYVGGEDSCWDGIQVLRPGCRLEWSPGEEPRIERYWDLPTDGLREAGEEQALDDEVREWFDRCVRDRLVADVPLGAFLSGGVDSTGVATAMAAALDEPLIACSVGFRERSHDELDLACQTASGLGAVHHTEVLEPDPRLALDVLPWFYDEPLSDTSTVPTYLVSKMAREHVTVALSGDGGDEVFGGYRRYVHDVAENRMRAAIGAPGRRLAAAVGSLYPKLDWAPRMLRARSFLTNVGADPAAAYWASVGQMSRAEALELLAPDVRARLAQYDPLDAFREHYERPRGVDTLYRAQYADFHSNLPDRILTKVDRASMAVSLEVRVPILDHRIVERFVHLPAAQKVRGSRGKHRLREALRPRLASNVLDATKRGFDTPVAVWLRGPLAGSVDTALASCADWFDRPVLQQRWAEHKSGRRDHSRLLWSVLVLEKWRERHEVQGLAS